MLFVLSSSMFRQTLINTMEFTS